jgi:hypothetical protein
MEKHFNLLSKIERIIVLFTLLFLLLINYTYSQIEFKVNEITVSHIVETIKYGHIIEGAFGNGPLITVSCEINNKTNDTIALDLENYKILIFFNYYEKKYEKELGSIVDEISLEFNKYFEKNKTNTILPNTKFLFSFMTPYLLGTELLKDTYPIVDCTTEVIETLPTLRVRYMDSNIDIITNEILKVTVANFIYNYD